MFENVGVKIKGMAKVFFAVGILVPLICGIIVIALDKNLAPIGVIIIFLGALLAWLATVLLYGFGELIHRTSLIESKLNPNQAEPAAKTNNKAQIKKALSLKAKFIQEIKETPTDDLKLILHDQQELYTEDELTYIRNEIHIRGQ